MIPLRDENKTATVPFVNILIIVANCLVFIWEMFSPQEASTIARLYGAIPSNLISFSANPETAQPIGPVTSVVTAMFIHGNVIHLAGNMLYLWIFGDNIEDTLGHLRYFFFYMFSGFAATYTFAATGPESVIPMVGASGAIAGILGAYVLLFPSARVLTLVFFGFFWFVRIPALVVIGFWAILQFLNGMLSDSEIQQGGIAWMAHVGGFLAGLITVKLWTPRKKYTSF